MMSSTGGIHQGDFFNMKKSIYIAILMKNINICEFFKIIFVFGHTRQIKQSSFLILRAWWEIFSKCQLEGNFPVVFDRFHLISYLQKISPHFQRAFSILSIFSFYFYFLIIFSSR